MLMKVMMWVVKKLMFMERKREKKMLENLKNYVEKKERLIRSKKRWKFSNYRKKTNKRKSLFRT